MADYNAVQNQQLYDAGAAVLGGIQSGQNIRKGILEDYQTRKKIEQQGKIEGLQQQYLGAADDKEKQAILQKMAVYNPEHAKGIAAIGQLGVNPFEGTSMEAQKANLQYQRYIAAGYPSGEARIKAINDAASTSAQYYTDPLGNRVTLGGIPLPDIGGQPRLGTTSTQQPQLGQAPLPAYGTGDKPSQADAVAARLPIQENLASIAPEEKSFITEVMNSPNPAQVYNTKVQEHPELAQAHPQWDDAIAGHFNEINMALEESVPTGAVLPSIDRKVTQAELNSPLAQKTRVEQAVGKEDLQTGTKAKIEEKLLNSTEALSRVKDIRTSFKPEYLQLGTRFGAATSSMKDFVGAKLSPEETQQLSDYTGFKRASVDNMNRLLNELSGAAVSPVEGTRIAASQPNAGTGVFDGDSPTVFKRKMDDVTKQMQYATLRYNYALKNGMNPLKTGIALEKIPELIEKRGAEIEKQIKASNPGAQQDIIDKQTKLQLGKEFGME